MLASDKIYECQTCGKTFNRLTYLQLHEKIHGEKCYKCNICDKAFCQPAGLWIHKKRQSCLKRNLPSNKRTSPCNAKGQFDEETDNNGKRHECDICSQRFSQKHLLTYHKRTHTGENPYPCTICGKMFRGAATLRYHERTHTGQKPYKCIFCVKAYTQLGPLRLHCRNEHQSEKIYECDVCKEQFEKFRELSSHKKTHLKISNQGKSPCQAIQGEAPLISNQGKSPCQAIQGEAPLNQVTKWEPRSSRKSRLASEVDEEEKDHTSVMQDNSSFCAKEKNAKGLQGLNKSKRTSYQTRSNTSVKDCTTTRHAESEISCISVNDALSASVCNERKTIADMDVSSLEDQVSARPIKEEYEDHCLNNGKKYKCNLCSQEFSQAHVLKYHKRIHTGENPHPCTVCSKTFRTPGALTVHERIHSGQKPYKCIFCFQGFTQRGALLQHCRRIHFSDQIYECDVCKEKFEKYRDLTSHSHVHSDVPCTVVKLIHDEVKQEDKSKHLQQMDATRLDSRPAISPLNVRMGDCDSDEETNSLVSAKRFCNIPHDGHEKHSTNQPNNSYEQAENMDISSTSECVSAMRRTEHEKDDCVSHTENNSQVVDSCQDDDDKHCTNPIYRAYKEIGNVNVSFLDECVPVSIKRKREDCDRSHDSGISPDTSPLDELVECDGRESDLIYEVPMQPIQMDHERKDYLLNVGNRTSQTIGSITISPQESENVLTDVVDECSKTISGDDELSNCSRVTTPDFDHIFSYSSGDLQRDSYFENESDTKISYEFSGNHTTVNNIKCKDDEPTNTSYYGLVKNSNCPSGSFYNSADFQSNSTDIDLVQEFSSCSNNMSVHSDVLINDDKITSSDMKFDGNVCESQTSTFWEHFDNEQNFTKKGTFPCFQNSFARNTSDDKKVYSNPSQGEMKHQCIRCGDKTGIALDDLQQSPKWEYGKTFASGIQYICFKCDVLPASCHLDKQ